MNPILQICPECNKHTKVELDKDNIQINCECGYNYTMNVKQIINQFDSDCTDNRRKGIILYTINRRSRTKIIGISRQ